MASDNSGGGYNRNSARGYRDHQTIMKLIDEWRVPNLKQERSPTAKPLLAETLFAHTYGC